LSKFAFGLFLIFTGAALCLDFQFNWGFLLLGIAGAVLVAYDLARNFGRIKRIYRSLSWSKVVEFYAKNRLYLGSPLALGASLSYFFCGFNWGIFTSWAIGIAVCAHAFFDQRKLRLEPITRADAVSLGALYLVSLPLYLWSVYTVPFHLNSDETVLLSFEQEYIGNGIVDVFGLSDYFGFMYFPFLLQGWLAQFLGSIDLYHVRLLNALTGTVIVACSYIFFRVLSLSWPLATVATLFVCFNHSLIALSRIASRTNGGLLLELLALSALFEGLKRKCPFTTYLGGFLAGVCFYVYYSARLTLPVWFLFLLLLFCLKPPTYTRKELWRFASIFLFSFALCIAPLIAAQIRQPDLTRDANAYQRRSCLLYPEAQIDAQRRWEAHSTKEGVLRSILKGLTVFNNTTMDQAYIYPNHNHGFVDPLSGLLIWIGLIRILASLPIDVSALFVVTGFVLQFLVFSFITYPTPSYTRLLVILPFTGYFAAHGTDAIASVANVIANKLNAAFARRIKHLVFVCITLSSLVLNLLIYYDYAQDGATHGDDIGGTARYLESRRDHPDHLFVLVADPDYLYFRDYSARNHYGQVHAYISSQQDCKVLTPEDLISTEIVPPFSIFMDGALWKLDRDQLNKMYPNLIVHKIADERDLVALEDPITVPTSERIHNLYRSWNDYASKMEDGLRSGQFEEVKRLGLEYLNSPTSAIMGSFFKSRVLRALGEAYALTHEYEKGEQLLLEAMTIREKLNSDEAETARSLAELYAVWHKWPKSEQYSRKAVAIRELALKDDPIDWIDGLVYDYKWLGIALWKQGKFEDAEKLFRYAGKCCRLDKGEGRDKEEILANLEACQKEHRKVTRTGRQ
jgi:tetratricopeptide (TPR) repeat protein